MIKKVYHITFPVPDIKKTVNFYENVLGLKKKGEWSNYVEFDVGGVTLAFELNGRFQMFLLVDNVDEAYKTFKQKGVEFITEPKDQFWGGRTAEFADPGENKFIIESFKKQTR